MRWGGGGALATMQLQPWHAAPGTCVEVQQSLASPREVEYVER